MKHYIHIIATLFVAIILSIYQSSRQDNTIFIFIFPMMINIINFIISILLKNNKLISFSIIYLILSFTSLIYYGILYNKLEDFIKVSYTDLLIYNFTSNLATFFGFVNFWIYYYFDNKITY